MPLKVGSRLAHYDVTALIGEGGYGPSLLGHRHEAQPAGMALKHAKTKSCGPRRGIDI